MAASILSVNRTEISSSAPLPPVTLTPEEAAAVAVALTARSDGPYAAAGRGALEKVLGILEPDPRRRSELLGMSAQVGRSAQRSSAESGRGARARHPAGRARRPGPEAPQPPRLVLLPGGRAPRFGP